MSRARANRRKGMKRRRIRQRGDGWPWPSQESIDRVAPMISISYDGIGAVLCTFGRGRPADATTVSWWYKRACLALNLGALESGVQLVEDAPRPEDEFPVVLGRIVKRSEAAGFRRCRVSGGVVEFLT